MTEIASCIAMGKIDDHPNVRCILNLSNSSSSEGVRSDKIRVSGLDVNISMWNKRLVVRSQAPEG